MKRTAITASLILTLILLLAACSGAPERMVTTPSEFLSELAKAEDGGVIYAGDVDFTPQPGVYNEFSRVELKKNVTVRSAYKDRDAVFKGGSFNIIGSKVPGECLECSFSGICFDGAVSSPMLFDYENAQYAVNFGGNVKATFDGCTFENYMFETGPAMRAFYGDYTGNPGLAELGDYSACRLEIMLLDCDFIGNAACCGGGAIYIDGNDNVTLTAEGCTFTDNLSGGGEFSEGGGALRISDIDARFSSCSFTGNSGNHRYEENPDEALYFADIDRTQGGAILSINGSLQVYDSNFEGNCASLGGAVCLMNSEAQIDSCTFTSNSADSCCRNPEGESGPWSGMGMGGALYIDPDPAAPARIYDTEFAGNAAQYGYGSIYGYYSDVFKDLMPLGMGSAELYSCTIRDNICRTVYDYNSEELFPWASHPGNLLDIEYMEMHGCVVIDESFEKDFPTFEEASAENDYCYFASPERAGEDVPSVSDIQVPDGVKGQWNSERKSAVPVERNTERRTGAFTWIIPAVVILAGLIAFFCMKKKPEPVQPETTAEKPQTAEAKAILSAAEIAALKENVELRQVLTEREMEIMCEYISGSSRSALAEKLCISESTAKTHISSIYSKLEVKSKTELIRRLKDL